MAKRLGWTREHLLIALRLYMRTRFGRLHGRNPEIIALAAQIGRTPGALAMKACNFASLDPAFRATNRTGLSGASASDRALWAEFTTDSERIAAEAEDVAAQYGQGVTAGVEPPAPVIPLGPTDVVQLVRVRRVQSFFRAAVLTSYESRCAISGIGTPALLVASHIIPWGESVERRADPRNGLCLNALFDRAFDRGLMTIDESLRVVVHADLLRAAGAADLGCSIGEAHGRALSMPVRCPPDPSALTYHRDHVFAGR
jgi:hypothetical protein